MGAWQHHDGREVAQWLLYCGSRLIRVSYNLLGVSNINNLHIISVPLSTINEKRQVVHFYTLLKTEFM